MHHNHGTRQRSARPSTKPVGSLGEGALRLISDSDEQQADPNRDNVVSMLRYGVGSVLDGLSEAQAKCETRGAFTKLRSRSATSRS